MKISIDIPDQYINILSKWASVSRTFDNIIKSAELGWELTEDKSEKDRAWIAIEEMIILRPILDHIHRLIRQEIWGNK